MTRTLALAQLTALQLPPPRLVALAAEVGCSAVGIRLWPTAPGTVVYPLLDDHAMRRETEAALRDTGVRILDVEVLRIGEDFSVARQLPILELCAQLGAAHINVVCDDRDEARLTARYAELCQAARPLGLSCDLEFMPWVALRNLADARRVLEAAAQPNGGVVIDALHVARSAVPLAQIEALPRAWLHWAQICDGPMPGPTTEAALIHAARCERLPPGEGALDLVGIFARLPRDLPLSIEVPHDVQIARLGHREWARRAKAATEAVLARLPA